MKKSIVSLLFIITILSFFGCSDDETNSSMTLTIDGEKEKVVTINGVLAFEEQYEHEGRGLNLTGVLSNGDYVVVSVSNWDFQSPPTNGVIEKTYYNVFDGGEGMESATCLDLDDGITSLCDGGLFTYLIEGEAEIYTSAFDEDVNGYIEITDNNSKNKKISGNFDLVVVGIGNEVEHRMTGSFKNVNYFVQH